MGVLTMKIGARSSRLSQAQTSIVSDLIKAKFGHDLVLRFVPVKTLGDRLQSSAKRRAGTSGEKGAFTSDLEALLLKGEIDVAIHSMKDLTSEETEGTAIGATPRRSDPRDALVASDGGTIRTLPRHARVGTSSLRRKAQLLGMRPDLEVVELRGNVDTRLRKVSAGADDLSAVVLAAAGLERIGEGARISQTFSIEEMVPAVGQGIIAAQMRDGDVDVGRVLSQIDDPPTRLESRCERAFAQRLGADCSVPVGGCATASGRTIRMVGMLAKKDCKDLRRKAVSGPSKDAISIGKALAEDLLAMRRRGSAS